MLKYLPVMLIGAAILFWLICAIRRRLHQGRFDRALKSDAVRYVVNFWSTHLRNHYQVADFEIQRSRFVMVLRNKLAQAYASTGAFPDIGVFYHRPHCYGVDDLIWSAMHTVGIVTGINRDIDEHHLTTSGRMKIAFDEVRMKSFTDAEDTVLWTAEKQYGSAVVAGAA